MWKRKKQKNMELTDEETEVAFKPPLFEIRKKKKYKKKPEKKEVVQKQKDEKPIPKKSPKKVLEDTISIRPSTKKVIELGLLKRGTKVSVECSERESGVVSFRVLDSTNFKKYKRHKQAPKMFLGILDEIDPKDSKSIRIDDTYYLILTTRAQYYSKNVWYRVEFKEVS